MNYQQTLTIGLFPITISLQTKKWPPKSKVIITHKIIGEEAAIEAKSNFNSMALKEKDPEIIVYRNGGEESAIMAQYKAQSLLSLGMCLINSSVSNSY